MQIPTLAVFTWPRQQQACSLGDQKASAGSNQAENQRPVELEQPGRPTFRGAVALTGKPGLEGASLTVTHLFPESLGLIVQQGLMLNTIIYRNTEQEENRGSQMSILLYFLMGSHYAAHDDLKFEFS